MNSVQFLEIKGLSLLLKNRIVFFRLRDVSLITKLEAVSRIYKALVSLIWVCWSNQLDSTSQMTFNFCVNHADLTYMHTLKL